MPTGLALVGTHSIERETEVQRGPQRAQAGSKHNPSEPKVILTSTALLRVSGGVRADPILHKMDKHTKSTRLAMVLLYAHTPVHFITLLIVLQGRCFHTHFTSQEREGQEGRVPSLRSHSQQGDKPDAHPCSSAPESVVPATIRHSPIPGSSGGSDCLTEASLQLSYPALERESFLVTCPLCKTLQRVQLSYGLSRGQQPG